MLFQKVLLCLEFAISFLLSHIWCAVSQKYAHNTKLNNANIDNGSGSMLALYSKLFQLLKSWKYNKYLPGEEGLNQHPYKCVTQM